MKTHCLLALSTLVLTTPAWAQTERGSKLIGLSVGNLSYGRGENNFRTMSANFNPSAGWFVADRLALGTGVVLNYYGYRRTFNSTSSGLSSYRSAGYGVAPFARYYLLASGKHRLFAQVSYEALWSRSRARFTDATNQTVNNFSTNSQQSLTAALGYNYFVTPNLALEATAGYRRHLGSSNAFQPVRGQLDLRAGFSFFLPSGKAAARE